MEKLKLEHLVPYLPYNLKCYVQGEGNKEFKMVGLDTDFVEYHERGRTVTEDCYIEDCFPILKPLNDLGKVMSHGCLLTPLYWFNNDDDAEEVYNNMLGLQKQRAYYLHNTKYKVYERLLAWHFDVFGLIEKDLAIDINTIK